MAGFSSPFSNAAAPASGGFEPPPGDAGVGAIVPLGFSQQAPGGERQIDGTFCMRMVSAGLLPR